VTSDALVRPARPDDQVAPVIREAFAEEGEWVAALWDEIAQSDAVRDSLVAELDGEVVGHVGLSHSWVDARRQLVDVWVLSPLSVVPRRQRSGIGTQLVEAAVGLARASGTPLLFLEGDPGYYGPRGFERADALGFAPASVRTPAPAFQVIRFEAHEDWMTGQLVYRDVWWRHDAAGLRDPRLAEVEAAIEAASEAASEEGLR
jgi:putative acetyltransferase